MTYRILADLTFVFHLTFIAIVVFGGFLIIRWPRAAWLHLPIACWGAAVVLFGWGCPLTDLENWFLRRGGTEGYELGFVEHYLAPIIYPSGLTRTHQTLLGIGVVLFNSVIYGWALGRRSLRVGA